MLQWYIGIIPPVEAVEEQEWSTACQLGFVLFPSLLEVRYNTLTNLSPYFSLIYCLFSEKLTKPKTIRHCNPDK